MSSIKLSAQKIKDVSNLQKIAEAWRECVINRGNAMNLNQASGWDWSDYGNWFAWTLAGCTQNPQRFYPSRCVLNDPHVYISSGDKYASKVLKEYVAIGVNTSKGCTIKEVNPWTSMAHANFHISGAPSGAFWSYCAIGNLNASVPLATTPLVVTRGLKTDGKWDEKYGLYGSRGGYVVFCDGHTTWFDGSRPAKFLHWDGQQYTTDIRQAVPNTARIGNGGVDSTATGDYSGLVIWGNGAGGN
jgi:hypothetical protein